MDPFDLRCWPGIVQTGLELGEPLWVDQIVIDSRRIDSNKALFVALPGTSYDGHQFIEQAARAGAKYALVERSWQQTFRENLTLLRVDNPLRAFQEIAKCYRMQKKVRTIGIAGSYGKTMVKDLLKAMIAAKYSVAASPESFNSQIGVPLSLLRISDQHDVAIIEAGTSKAGEMGILSDIIAPDCGILTHIGKKHVETFGDIAVTAKEMMKLMQVPQKDGWIIIPKDILIQPHLENITANHFFWNIREDQLPFAENITPVPGAMMSYQVIFPDGNHFIGHTTFGFYYYLDLINITVKAAWLLNISSSDIVKTLQHYKPEPMRTEIWKTPIGATLINDTYCSDPLSVDLALKHLEQTPEGSRRFFIFSGMREESKFSLEKEYRRIGQAIGRSNIDQLALVGSYQYQPLAEEVSRRSPATSIALYRTIQEALFALKEGLKQEDFVLFKGASKTPLDELTEALHDSVCTNQCIINLAAIKTNLALIKRKLNSSTRILVMVKALAYGTDDVRIAKFLANCDIDILGVSYVDEGVALKRAGISQDIFVINAATYEAAKIAKWSLEVGVSEIELIETLAMEAEKAGRKIKVHLHVDTGMSRFGCRPEEALDLALTICNRPWLILEGIMTHFACADNPEQDTFTYSQADTFQKVISQLESKGIDIPWKHAANSSAVMRFDFPNFNMVRIGLAVFGLYSSQAARRALELRLALSLVSRVVGINICKAGESISYGRQYRVEKDLQRIAVLPIGYFDGLHRNYSGKGHVIIRGQKAPMVGTICMDFMMVDITNIPNACIGDTVLIFGEDEYGHYLSPEDLASCGDSIVYELITCLGPRIQRIFVYEEACQAR